MKLEIIYPSRRIDCSTLFVLDGVEFTNPEALSNKLTDGATGYLFKSAFTVNGTTLEFPPYNFAADAEAQAASIQQRLSAFKEAMKPRSKSTVYNGYVITATRSGDDVTIKCDAPIEEQLKWVGADVGSDITSEGGTYWRGPVSAVFSFTPLSLENLYTGFANRIAEISGTLNRCIWAYRGYHFNFLMRDGVLTFFSAGLKSTDEISTELLDGIECLTYRGIFNTSKDAMIFRSGHRCETVDFTGLTLSPNLSSANLAAVLDKRILAVKRAFNSVTIEL